MSRGEDLAQRLYRGREQAQRVVMASRMLVGQHPAWLEQPFRLARQLSWFDNPSTHELDNRCWHNQHVFAVYTFGPSSYWEARRLRLLYALFAPPQRSACRT